MFFPAAVSSTSLQRYTTGRCFAPYRGWHPPASCSWEGCGPNRWYNQWIHMQNNEFPWSWTANDLHSLMMFAHIYAARRKSNPGFHRARYQPCSAVHAYAWYAESMTLIFGYQNYDVIKRYYFEFLIAVVCTATQLVLKNAKRAELAQDRRIAADS